MKFNCPVLMYYIDDMVTFTALAKVYSTEYFCNTKVAGLGEIFVQRKISAIQYLISVVQCLCVRVLLC